ncbi:MAG TPA: hypothetical protein VFV37_01705 [Luteibaculaceae bacterium]|nr:hypothetical protein [Luteibaculaceae bacterium]
MKTTGLILKVTAIILFAQVTFAQHTFSFLNGVNYQELSNPTLITPPHAWADDFDEAIITLPFSFETGMGAYTNLITVSPYQIKFRGNESVVDVNPMLCGDNFLVDANYDPNLGAGNQAIPGNSSISYAIEGPAGNRIFKLQYRNVKWFTSQVGDFINFQVWIHEVTSLIEFRYGPNSINTPRQEIWADGGLNIGMALYTGVISKLAQLEGLSTAPSYKFSTTTDPFYVNDFPINGTVYQFGQTNVGINQVTELTPFVVNPLVDGRLNLQLPPAFIFKGITIRNSTGQVVFESREAKSSYDVDRLTSGTYLLQFTGSTLDKAVTVVVP